MSVPSIPEYSESERRELLRLAREALNHAVTKGSLPELTSALPKKFTEHRGCFVTLEIGESLRGCIGNLTPKYALALAVQENARSAALNDPRFSPVIPAELGIVRIEISVLSVPAPLAFASPEDLLEKLVPGRDGVVLERAAGRATFLPQVWEKVPDPRDFLSHLARKAGFPASGWREPDCRVLIYSAEAFREDAP